jgi:hypothetical protein
MITERSAVTLTYHGCQDADRSACCILKPENMDDNPGHSHPDCGWRWNPGELFPTGNAGAVCLPSGNPVAPDWYITEGQASADQSGELIKAGVRFVFVGLVLISATARAFPPFTAKAGIQHDFRLFLPALLSSPVFAARLTGRTFRMPAMVATAWVTVLLFGRHWAHGRVRFDAIDIPFQVDRGLVLPIQTQQADVIAYQIDDGHAQAP